jgi:cytochrome c heme-lyase
MPTPFDRHDYVVDRCGTHYRYICEFYQKGDHDFEVDARPALNQVRLVLNRVVAQYPHDGGDSHSS